MMKISVITVCYNASETIDHCIKSVRSQNYPAIEHIIIDGGSTDGTMELLGQYRDQVARCVCEPDAGIYDAMNKGIRLATGDVVGCLNSDDFYADDRVISDVASVFNDCEIDCCYSDLEYVDYRNTEKVVRHWKSRPFSRGLFKTGWHPPHPTFFARRDMYTKYGLFDLDLNISADYEIMLRFLERYGVKSYYIPRVLVKMRIGGISNRSLKQLFKANIQCCQAWKKNGFRISLFTAIRKPLSKLLQLRD